MYVCWLVGWLKRLMAVATVPGHNLHRQISGSAPKTSSQTLPASFWWSVKSKPDQKEQNPMTASQKPPAHTASPLFQKKPRRCQTRIHTSSSSAMDKASRAPRTATSPKSSVGIAAGSELGPTPSSPKTCSTRPRSANAGCITVAAPVRYMCKLNIWGKENKVGEKEDNLSNNLSTWSTLAAAPNPLTYKPGGCRGVKGFTDALVVAGLGVLVRRGLS